MADVVDEYGNPVQLTDELGNPVKLTDEHGNPMHLTGVAVHPGSGVVATETKVAMEVSEPPLAVYEGATATQQVVGAEGERIHGSPLAVQEGGISHVGVEGERKHGPPLEVHEGVIPHVGVEGERKETLSEKLEHEGKVEKIQPSSSSSSSEDDGQGGRRKKKGLKQKIKEKLGVGKHKDREEHAPYPTTVTTETRPGEHPIHHEHEKKSMIEKIKEKLPGHH